MGSAYRNALNDPDVQKIQTGVHEKTRETSEGATSAIDELIARLGLLEEDKTLVHEWLKALGELYIFTLFRLPINTDDSLDELRGDPRLRDLLATMLGIFTTVRSWGIDYDFDALPTQSGRSLGSGNQPPLTTEDVDDLLANSSGFDSSTQVALKRLLAGMRDGTYKLTSTTDGVLLDITLPRSSSGGSDRRGRRDRDRSARNAPTTTPQPPAVLPVQAPPPPGPTPPAANPPAAQPPVSGPPSVAQVSSPPVTSPPYSVPPAARPMPSSGPNPTGSVWGGTPAPAAAGPPTMWPAQPSNVYGTPGTHHAPTATGWAAPSGGQPAASSYPEPQD